MQTSPTFSDLLAQPGSSTPAQPPPTAAGGFVLNDASKQAALSAPNQQARVRTQTSMERLKTLAQKLAQESRGGF